MKTKKIIADTMPLALKMVRQQLGENAIIVNTKQINTGGVFGLFAKQKYEVTAYSIDRDEGKAEPRFSLDIKKDKQEFFVPRKSVYEKEAEEQNRASVFHSRPQKLYSYYAQPAADTEKPKESRVQVIQKNEAKEEKLTASSKQPLEKDQALFDELQQMRKMMMNLMMNDKQGTVLPVVLNKWVGHLKKQGVEEEVVDFIINSLFKKHESMNDLNEEVLKNEIFAVIVDIIEKRIPSTHTINDSTRMINVIGPTGVGKTTSVAKLATEQVLKQKRRVAMITTDVYRIAAVEQLKTYAGILNVPIEVVRSASELGKVLSKLEHYDLIYMDTTGRNYKDVKYRDSINEYLTNTLESDNYLVLSLTTKFDDIQILLNEFLDSPIKKLILTKFDETSSYGSILNIAFNYPYQLAYMTNGQSVPEDITTIDSKLLASQLLGEDM